MAQRNILVAGATGYVGRDVVRELVKRGHAVNALMRAESATHENRWVDDALKGADRCLWSDLESAGNDWEADTVVSCIASRTGVAQDAWHVDYQLNMQLLEAAQRRGVKRFVLLSAICVQKPRLAFQFAKLEFESALAASGLEYAIIRPTAYFKSLAGQIGRIQSGKPYLMFGDGELTACKPISTSDLASFIANATDGAEAPNRILPIGGPGTAITPREQGEMLFRLAGLAPKFRSVPPAMLKVVAGALTPLGVILPGLRAKAELARIGHYYATESMLVWDTNEARYSAQRTPSFGSDTLEDFFTQALTSGLGGHELGAQQMFSRAED